MNGTPPCALSRPRQPFRINRLLGWLLVYDGECPFCSSYVKFVRIRESLGQLELVNARQGGPIVEEVRAALNLEKEVVVLKFDGRLYCGPDCLQVLASLSSASNLFNRVNGFIFRSATLSRWLFPVMWVVRVTALRLLGRARFADG